MTRSASQLYNTLSDICHALIDVYIRTLILHSLASALQAIIACAAAEHRVKVPANREDQVAPRLASRRMI